MKLDCEAGKLKVSRNTLADVISVSNKVSFERH